MRARAPETLGVATATHVFELVTHWSTLDASSLFLKFHGKSHLGTPYCTGGAEDAADRCCTD